MNNNLYKRLAAVEAYAAAAKAQSYEVLNNAYAAACENRNFEDAAELVRAIRLKMLKESDAEMSLDRLGLDTTSPIKFIASISNVLNGEWAKYRRELRDLTEKEGFPFDVVFPEPPSNSENNA